jgi:hypothetical protein
MAIRQFGARSAVVSGIGVLIVMVGGLGVATAANGGSLTLGHSNTTTKTTTIKDSHGTPLSLVGKTSKPPLKVNSSTQVPHLNSSLLGGLSSTQLATAGSSARTGVNLGLSIDTSPTMVAQTAVLSPGTYYVLASALLESSVGGFCYVGTSDDPSTALQWGGADGSSTADTIHTQANESLPVVVTSSERIGEYCESNSESGDLANAGIVAIKVANDAPGTAATVDTSQ